MINFPCYQVLWMSELLPILVPVDLLFLISNDKRSAGQLFNPVWYDPSVMNIWYGGGQKYLRYILQLYIGQFKSDYSGVKSKSEVHIIRSHLEKKNCKNFQKWMSYRCFCLSFENSKKIWEKKFWDSKSFLLGQFSKYWGLVFCKHPQFVSIKGF